MGTYVKLLASNTFFAYFYVLVCIFIQHLNADFQLDSMDQFYARQVVRYYILKFGSWYNYPSSHFFCLKDRYLFLMTTR